MNKKAIARKLLIFRKQKGFSQEQLADQSGVALRTIQRIEAGAVNAHLQTLALIAIALEIEVKELTIPIEPENKDKTNNKWLILMHLSPLIGSIFPSGSLLIPLVFWLFKRHEDETLDLHGKAVINFQISMLFLFIIALIMVFVYTPIGILLIFTSIILNVIMVVINSWKVAHHKKYFYPLSIKMISSKAKPIYAMTLLSFFLFTQPGTTKAQQISRIDGSKVNTAVLQNQITALMKSAKVKGMEVAILNQNKVVYKHAFGIANNTPDSLLKTTTSIYGASLSKTIFTVLVLKLVEEGILNLDKPLQDYLDKPIYEYPTKTKWQDHYEDLRNDSNYKKITARMCLDHTSGFPNWRWDNSDQKLKIRTVPGTTYSYSGEGMVYLQTVIERMLGKTLDQLMLEQIFAPIGMKNSAYTFLPRFETSYALGYNTDGKAYQKDKDNEARAPSTLETTFDDYTKFIEAVMQAKILKNQSIKEMFRPQIRLRSIHQFGPLSRKDTTAYDNISLSYGLGWGLLKSPYGWGAFKEGHGDGFQHYCILFPETGTGIVIMTNSDNGESIFKELLAITIADKYTPWKWQNYIPYNYTGK